jgi:hypothetical protein
MFYVHLYEHPLDLLNGGRKLELNVSTDGTGGIPLDTIDKYIAAGVISPITAVRWRLPVGGCVELYPERFWKGDPCVLEGTGADEAIDLRSRGFDDCTKSALIRVLVKSPWCVTIIPNPAPVVPPGGPLPTMPPVQHILRTIYASSEADAHFQALELWKQYQGNPLYGGYGLAAGQCPMG